MSSYIIYFILLYVYCVAHTTPICIPFSLFLFIWREREKSILSFQCFFMKSQLVLLVEWKNKNEKKIVDRKRKRKHERKREIQSLMRFTWIINVYAFAIGFTKIALTHTVHTHMCIQNANFHRDTGRAFIISYEWNTFPDIIEIHLVIHENKFI